MTPSLESVVAQIEQALEAGPTPGPWTGPVMSDSWPPGWIAVCESYEDAPQEHIPGGYFVHTGHWHPQHEAHKDDSQSSKDAAFIASCNPHNIRILLDALKEAQRDARRYRGFIDTAGRQPICFLGLDYYGKEDLDAAIDKAMEQPK